MTTGLSPPLDRRDLERALAPLGRAVGLPAAAYVSPDAFAWEMRHFFEGSWTCVGRAAVVGRDGHQTAVRAGSEAILLVRDGEALRGYHNVCRHRGHELLEVGDRNSARVIRCPYHSWTYDLAGRLKHAPRLLRGHEEIRLAPVRVEQWQGWAFVNVAGRTQSFDAHVGRLAAIVDPYSPDRLVHAARRRYDVRANWKLITENYHECYHCPTIHPQLCRVTPADSGVNVTPDGAWVGGWMDLSPHAVTMSSDGTSRGSPIDSLPERERRRVAYFGLFPNLLMSLHPDYVLTHRLEPVAPDRTIVECEWLFPCAAAESGGFDPSYAVDFWDTTNVQDWRACESVQRGVSSRAYRPGPLTSREDAVHHFIGLVARGYLEDGE